MRRTLVLIAVVVACAKSETAKVDTAAMAAPPAPVVLTEADIAGTWKGTSMLAGSDSVFGHWTQVCANGTCKGSTAEQPKDTVVATYMLMADSVMGVSQPSTVTGIKGKVVDHWIVHVKDGKATGTGMMTLASKPDSVVVRYRFEGGRAP